MYQMSHPYQPSQQASDDAASYQDETDQFPPPPPYMDNEGKTIIPATAKFPPTMNAYLPWKFTRTLHLGPSAEHKLYTVETHSGGLTGKKPMIILYDGASSNSGVLATAGSGNWKQTRYVITIPARGGQDGDLVVSMSAATITSATHKFSIPVGGKGRGTECEDFEWRSSSGEEIKALSKGRSWGWKLVRLSGPNVKPGGSSTAEREVGFTSDGREVVAVMALNTASLSKVLRFAFSGSGLTGTLGETWEIIALTSALQIWWMYYQTGS